MRKITIFCGTQKKTFWKIHWKSIGSIVAADFQNIKKIFFCVPHKNVIKILNSMTLIFLFFWHVTNKHFLFGWLSQLPGVCWLLTCSFSLFCMTFFVEMCGLQLTVTPSDSLRSCMSGWRLERQFCDGAVPAVTVLYIDTCGEILNCFSKVTENVLNPLRFLFNCVCVQRWMTWLCIWTSCWQFLSRVPLVPLKEASAASGLQPKRLGRWCLWCTKPESSIYTVSHFDAVQRTVAFANAQK